MEKHPLLHAWLSSHFADGQFGLVLCLNVSPVCAFEAPFRVEISMNENKLRVLREDSI